MMTKLFLGFSLLGAEWVMFLLVLISLFSVTLMFERARFYGSALKNIEEFRKKIRDAVQSGEWDRAREIARHRLNEQVGALDLETPMAVALLEHKGEREAKVLNEVGNDPVVRTRIQWEKNLSVLATIGNNAPFVGLFGTVLGIIKAFQDLSQQAAGGVTTVMSGISEALVATGVGILVAIPAVVAYNIFQRRNKTALMQAESLKSFLVAQLISRK